mmetsp:Transcript_74276/g.204626  ORF Transcript_74276/g.204626 Transcript_74276/m.204626 type:complete len:233 (-) Transcript_74276:88-786(-)
MQLRSEASCRAVSAHQPQTRIASRRSSGRRGRAVARRGIAALTLLPIDRELTERAHLLLLEPLLSALSMKSMQARQRPYTRSHRHVLEADAARSELLWKLRDIVHDPRRRVVLNVTRSGARAVVLQMLNKLPQNEKLQRRDLAGLQPPQQLLLSLHGGRRKLSARIVHRGIERRHGPRRSRHSVDRRAVRAANMVELRLTYHRRGEDALTVVAPDLRAPQILPSLPSSCGCR